MKKLVLASRNEGKLREVRRLLAGMDLEVVDLNHYPEAPVVVEDGMTFAENAKKKALSVAAHANVWTLADDSGLEVQALAGKPGVLSARYAGMHGDDRANMEKLLAEMRDIPSDRREARFVCVLALATPDGSVRLAPGECKGRIGYGPKGTNGFGYDPIFFLPQYRKMMAELSEEEKNLLSHRAQAFRIMRPIIQAELAAGGG